MEWKAVEISQRLFQDVGETAPSVKGLPGEREDLSLDL